MANQHSAAQPDRDHRRHHPSYTGAKSPACQTSRKSCKGPDFPTGGYILDARVSTDAYTKGRGHLKIRAKAKIERTGKDQEQIIVDELPYQVNKAKLIENVAALIQ